MHICAIVGQFFCLHKPIFLPPLVRNVSVDKKKDIPTSQPNATIGQKKVTRNYREDAENRRVAHKN